MNLPSKLNYKYMVREKWILLEEKIIIIISEWIECVAGVVGTEHKNSERPVFLRLGKSTLNF